MANTPEGKVKEKVKKVLRAYNVYWHCPVQNGLGAPSLDFVGCCNGYYFAVETKAGNKQPTPRQALTMQQITDAGGKAFLINEETGLDFFEQWICLHVNKERL